LADRGLADRSRAHYEQLLRDHILPTFGSAPVPSITSAAVRTWNSALGKRTGPTASSHPYGLLRTIMNTAVADESVSGAQAQAWAGDLFYPRVALIVAQRQWT
jgi:hypothetical protein